MNLKKAIFIIIIISMFLMTSSGMMAAEFHQAAKKGDLDTIKSLLAKDPKLLDSVNRLNQTALLIASYTGDESMVKFLLEKGADTNKQDNFGSTALHMAALGGHEKIVELLLDKGANMATRSYNGKIPLQMAFEGGHIKVIQVFFNRGIQLNQTIDSMGRTFLHKAAILRKINILEFLLSKGMDINAKDKTDRTALDLAMACGFKDVVAFLREKGANAEPLPEIKVVYVANNGFVVGAGNQKVMIDSLFKDAWGLYSTPSKKVVEAFQRPDHPVSGSKYILVTHNRRDHFDPEMVEIYMKKNNNSILISPSQVNLDMNLYSLSWSSIKNRTVSLTPAKDSGTTLSVKDLKLMVFRLRHPDKVTESLGFVIDLNGRTVCHLGDALLKENNDILNRFGFKLMGIDVAFIQYNDFMDEESRKLINPLLAPKHIVLMHIPLKELKFVEKEIQAFKKDFPNVHFFKNSLEEISFK